MSYDYYNDQPDSHSGLISLANIIDKLRKEVPNSLLVDNGDFLQGSPISNYLQEYSIDHINPVISVMNALHYDVGTLGNHEFDFGIPYLETILQQSIFPIVNANIVSTKDNSNWITPYIILSKELCNPSGEKQALKIGVTGALPPQVADWNRRVFHQYAECKSQLSVLDITETIKNTLPKMKQVGADIVIVLAHTGFSDKPYRKGAENAASYLAHLDGIDILITGHAHHCFPNDLFPEGKIGDKPVVMPGAFGQYVGVIDLELKYDANDKQWSIDHSNTQLVPAVNSDNKSKYQALIATPHEMIRTKMRRVIGLNETHFASYLSMIQDDACIQIVADAQIVYAKEMLTLLSPEYQSLPIIAAVPSFKVGGRKDSPNDYIDIPEGEFTFRNIVDLYHFNNQMALLVITGQELREWLECAFSIYHHQSESLINWKDHRAYKRDVIKGGITYSVDISIPRRYNGEGKLIHPEACRIHSLCFEGKEVSDDMQFIISTSQYRAYSGQFPGTGEDKVIALSEIEIVDIMERYIRKNINKNGALTVVPSFNWHLDFSKLNHSVYFETSSSIKASQYIKSYSKIPMEFDHKDDSGFAVFRIG